MLPDDARAESVKAASSVEQAARRLGVSIRAYHEVEAGARSPNSETFDRICRTFGLAQIFAAGRRSDGCLPS